jgi:hypothetical protein
MDGWMFFSSLRSAQVSTASQTQCIAQGKSALYQSDFQNNEMRIV